jgi:hypothetical protein
MKNITKDQLSKLHVLLNQLGLMADKKEIVRHYSNGRTESSKELTIAEAGALIGALAGNDGNDRMRRKIFALAYDAGIIYGDTPEDKKMNAVKLNQFLLKSGTVKKELNKLQYNELVKTVTQFTQIVKHKGESVAAKQTKSLLEELNITSSFKQRSAAI